MEGDPDNILRILKNSQKQLVEFSSNSAVVFLDRFFDIVNEKYNSFVDRDKFLQQVKRKLDKNGMQLEKVIEQVKNEGDMQKVSLEKESLYNIMVLCGISAKLGEDRDNLEA